MESDIINLSYVKNLRIKNKLSTIQISTALGYKSYQAYHRKENGERILTVEDLVKLSKIYNVPLEKKIFLHMNSPKW